MDAYAKRTGRDATFAIGDADAILVSGGRFLIGVGNGWNEDEMANHGTAFASRLELARERVEAMKVIWTESTAEYHASS